MAFGGILKGVGVVALIAVGIQIVPNLVKPKNRYSYDGFVDERFKQVEAKFKGNFEKGWEPEGAAFAVYYDGKSVVDLWGGFADKDSGRIWEKDTVCCVFSTTKATAALAAAMLVDRRHMSYDDLVTKYWPEFGKHGKANLTVGMYLSHESGLSATTDPITYDAVTNYDQISQIIANSKTLWPPGTAAGYHALTYGFLVDQLVSRVDPQRRNLSTFLTEEVFKPHDIDFSIGIQNSEFHRAARYRLSSPWQTFAKIGDWKFIKTSFQTTRNFMDPTSCLHKSFNAIKEFAANGATLFNDPKWAATEIAAANGFGTARALAKLFSLVGNEKLLSKKMLKFLATPRNQGMDKCLDMPTNNGYGFWYWKTPNHDNHWAFGHPGYGGQMALVDPVKKLSYAYITNGHGPSIVEDRFKELEKTLYDAVKKLQKPTTKK